MQKRVHDSGIARQLANILPPFIAAAILGSATPIVARDVKISGGMSVGYEQYERQYDNDTQSEADEAAVAENQTVNRDDKYNRFRLAPLVEISSATPRDELSLRYSPSFRYDYETYASDVDHDFNAAIQRSLTRDWRLVLTENYLLTDRAEDRFATETDTDVKLSDNGARRKYWTNNVKLVSEYSYWEGGLFSLGYNYGILENMDVVDGDNYENYDRHEVQFTVGHNYNSRWKSIVSGSYVRGLYDVGGAADRLATDLSTEKDLNEYRALTKLEYRLIEHHPLSLGYSYYGVDYDAADRKNGAIHDLTFGWQWLISKAWTYALGGGPSYVETEGQDGSWGYNANTVLQYGFERGSVALSATRGYERQNFNGTNENGLTEFWQSRLDIKYEIFRDFSCHLFSAYRYEDQDVVTERPPVPADSAETAIVDQDTTETETFNRKRFSVGSSVGYKFWQWYTVALSYDYAVQDSEKVNDSYDDHRILLTLSVRTDLWNW